MSVLQWSCYFFQCIVAKETCCQPSCLLLSLHCLPLSLPLLHCPWPEGTVGFLNALPPLWAHIDWLSAPPKAEQHEVPAASFLLMLLKKKKKSLKEKNEGRKSSGGSSTTCLGMSLLFLCASPVVMRINGVYNISLMSFFVKWSVIVFASVCRALSSSSSSSPCFVDQTPLLSLQRCHQVIHDPTTQETPNSRVVRGRTRMSLEGLVKWKHKICHLQL